MANLRIDHESKRQLNARLNSPEGDELLDNLFRLAALSLVDEWIRRGKGMPTPELVESELRAVVQRMFGANETT
ncbi:MAG TPA: hypothetical protein VMF52_02090 [Steroidobacteraceae bacterium]|nr:hypothetical protein [Steroidobacteraceae bacterium]